MKVLIDALYINNGGGKILLDYLISSIEEEEIDVCYLLDDRVNGKIPNVKSSNVVVYMKARLFSRFIFYKKNDFDIIFCFGNIPPYSQSKGRVYTYFHNPMYLEIPKEFSFVQQLIFSLKIFVINRTKNNTNYWLVQSPFIKNEFQRKFHVAKEKVKVLPFYHELNNELNNEKRVQNHYIYVSNGNPHKNHEKLIEAFCLFFDEFKVGKLTLTINEDYPKILLLIKNKIDLGYPIQNIGFVSRDVLTRHYNASRFLIFPSLAESFGLGLIEAIECGCDVIGADLSYTYEVCEPSIVFNPNDVTDIYLAFKKSMDTNIPKSKPLIKNNMNEILNILSK